MAIAPVIPTELPRAAEIAIQSARSAKPLLHSRRVPMISYPGGVRATGLGCEEGPRGDAIAKRALSGMLYRFGPLQYDCRHCQSFGESHRHQASPEAGRPACRSCFQKLSG